jgi:hypothetical protein
LAQLLHAAHPELEYFPVPQVIHALWPVEPWYLTDKTSKESEFRQLAKAHSSCY